MLSNFTLEFAVFAGAIISGFMGFAFSAVAGAFLFHILPPIEAIPLMMVCSIIVQAISLIYLRRTIEWQGSAMFILGGVLGVLPALYLLLHVEAHAFRVCFGIMLACYSAYMLLRPSSVYFQHVRGTLCDAIVGFAGGLIGGLTAMPGALPTIWCDLRGLPKERQRGLVQPFIIVMQFVALMILLTVHGLSFAIIGKVVVCLPALAVGTALGIILFGRLNGILFRGGMLVALLIAGMALVA
jgi:uncharacterized membrane protein YfcA